MLTNIDLSKRCSGVQLNRLSGDDGRIIDVLRKPDGGFRLIEGCDGYFYVEMTADELRDLGRELIAIAGQPLAG